MSDEQQSQTTTTGVQESRRRSAPPPEAAGMRWGDPISEERQTELAALMSKQQEWLGTPATQRGFSAFNGMRLTGADVHWLAQHSQRDQDGRLLDFNLDGADLEGALLAGADLFNASLNYVNGSSADFDRANLTEAKLIGARMRGASMKGAEMSGVRLDGAFMRGAKLVGANLRTALLDRETSIAGVQLVDERGVSPRFADVRWGDADIDRTNWTIVKVLGDNVIDHQFFAGTAGNERERRLRLLTDAVRANRQIATLLRGRGLTDEADRFAYQAQVLQRRLNFKVRRYGRWLFSELLSVLSGYGYRLGNIFRAYVVVVAFFALAYVFSPFLSTGHVPSGQDVLNAVQISLNAIHGRVFFAQFSLDTLQSWLATAESICGIVIEGVFVAMLIQRLFR